MTSKEFVIWLKGFSKAANSYNITPAQWDEIREELAKVNDGGFSIGVGAPGGISTSTTYSYPTTTHSYPSGSSLSYTNS